MQQHRGPIAASQVVPVRVPGGAIGQWQRLYLYGAEQTDEDDDTSPYRFLAVPADGGADSVYGDETDAGWVWPRCGGLALAKIAAEGYGSCQLESIPLLTRVDNQSGLEDFTDTSDLRAIAPVVQASDGKFYPLFQAAEGRGSISGTDVTAVAANCPEDEVYPSYSALGGTKQVVDFWHNLGAVRNPTSNTWICVLMRIETPVLYGITVDAIGENESGDVDILTDVGDGSDLSDVKRSPWRMQRCRSAAELEEGTIVQLVFAAGWWRIVTGGGGGGSCPLVHYIESLSATTGGTFSAQLEVPDVVTGDGTGTTSATLSSIPYNATATEIKTAIETHPEVTSADVSVTLGPLPQRQIQIKWQGALAGLSFEPMVISNTNLTPPGSVYATGSFTPIE